MNFLRKNPDKMPVFTVSGAMTTPYLCCAAYLVYAAWRYASVNANGDYSSLFYFIHAPIHEVGHWVCSAFPETMHVAGGTLFQWLTPVAVGVQFWRTGEFPALAVCLGWLGMAMLDTMVYMRDAPVLELPLTAPFANGEDLIHDWNFLFSSAGILDKAETIASVTGFFGYVLALGGALWILFMIGRGWLGFFAERRQSRGY